MFDIKVLQDQAAAEKIGDFLTGEFAFEQTWAPKEKEMVKKAPIDSLGGNHHRYWYIEDSGQIVAAIGVRENKYGSGGYEMDSDYVAVHRDYRNKGLATRLLTEVEKYVKENGGRFIHVVTCDIESYKAARNFYEKNKYAKVGSIPDYYVPGEGRIDYFKKI